MDGNKLIDNLLSYAVKYLYLNELDLSYKKSVLCTVLNVKYNADVALSENVDLSKLVEQLKEFIKENKTGEYNEANAVDYIFGLIMPLPSLVDRSFKSLRERMGAQKAFSYFYNLSKAGDFSSGSDKNFIEFESKKPVRIKLANYPKNVSPVLDENRLNKCKIFLDFASKSYVFSSARVSKYPYHGMLTLADNKDFSLSENAIEAMLSFVEYAPEFFISSSLIKDNEEKLYSKFFVGKDDLPFFKSKPHFTAKSELYHDVEVAYTDWFVSTLRLASYNKNTLINTALEVINAWGVYTDSENPALATNDKRFVSVFASMLKDGRYAISIVLRNGNAKEDVILGSEENKRFFEKSDANSAILGVFTLSENFYKAKITILNILTKKQAFKPSEQLSVDNELYLFSDFVSSIINTYGYFKDVKEAETALYETLVDTCGNILGKLNVFNKDETNFIALKRFLMSVKIK